MTIEHHDPEETSYGVFRDALIRSAQEGKEDLVHVLISLIKQRWPHKILNLSEKGRGNNEEVNPLDEP